MGRGNGEVDKLPLVEPPDPETAHRSIPKALVEVLGVRWHVRHCAAVRSRLSKRPLYDRAPPEAERRRFRRKSPYGRLWRNTSDRCLRTKRPIRLQTTDRSPATHPSRSGLLDPANAPESPAFRRRHRQDRLLDVRGEVQHVHDLRDRARVTCPTRASSAWSATTPSRISPSNRIASAISFATRGTPPSAPAVAALPHFFAAAAPRTKMHLAGSGKFAFHCVTPGLFANDLIPLGRNTMKIFSAAPSQSTRSISRSSIRVCSGGLSASQTPSNSASASATSRSSMQVAPHPDQFGVDFRHSPLGHLDAVLDLGEPRRLARWPRACRRQSSAARRRPCAGPLQIGPLLPQGRHFGVGLLSHQVDRLGHHGRIAADAPDLVHHDAFDLARRQRRRSQSSVAFRNCRLSVSSSRGGLAEGRMIDELGPEPTKIPIDLSVAKVLFRLASRQTIHSVESPLSRRNTVV